MDSRYDNLTRMDTSRISAKRSQADISLSFGWMIIQISLTDGSDAINTQRKNRFLGWDLNFGFYPYVLVFYSVLPQIQIRISLFMMIYINLRIEKNSRLSPCRLIQTILLGFHINLSIITYYNVLVAHEAMHLSPISLPLVENKSN